jgi:hypothetical protein
MNRTPTFVRALFAGTPMPAGVTVIDFGALQNNCCGDVPNTIHGLELT